MRQVFSITYGARQFSLDVEWHGMLTIASSEEGPTIAVDTPPVNGYISYVDFNNPPVLAEWFK